MLRPIPSKILRSTATVKVCTAIDVYQNQTYATYTVDHVHLQPTDKIVKSKDNTDNQLSSVLFADRVHSTPFDWSGQLEAAHRIGGDVRVIIRGTEYTVLAVDALRDDTDHFHHWEIGLM